MKIIPHAVRIRNTPLAKERVMRPLSAFVLVFSEAQIKSASLHTIRARGADFQVGGLTRTRKREPTRGVRGHAPPGKFEILFF